MFKIKNIILLLVFLILLSGLASAMNGSGTESSPYNITNCTDLQSIEDNLTAYYQLVNNINCSDTTTWNSGAGFIPIGNNSLKFEGYFDGNNYTLFDLYINTTTTPRLYVGLFGFTSNGAELKNVNIYDAIIDFNLCNATAMMTYNNVGVLSGMSSEGTIISNVKTSGTIYTPRYGGGISGTLLSNSIINNCSSSVNFIKAGESVGGLVGRLWDGEIKESFYDGTISISSYECGGTVTPYNFGGITGVFYNSTIEDSYAIVSMTNLTAIPSVFSDIGGAVGSVSTVGGNITNVYVVPSFSFNGSTHHNCFIGRDVSAPVVNNSYYNNETCIYGDSYATGKSTEDMKQESTFVDWDFDDTWEIWELSTFPKLKTSINKIEITNCTELQNINDNVYGDYVLMNDIDCSETTTWNGGAGFLPIDRFYGSLDGNNYEISNVYINTTDYLAGLFSRVNNVFIHDLRLKDFNVTSNTGVAGALTGYTYGEHTDYCILENIIIDGGDIKGTASVGGLIPSGASTGIYNVYTNTNLYLFNNGNWSINMKGRSGGIAGSCSGCNIYNSYSTSSFKTDVREGSANNPIFSGVASIGSLGGSGWTDVSNAINSYSLITDIDIDSGFTDTSSFGTVSGTTTSVYYYDGVLENDFGSGTSKSLSELKQEATFVDWDFNDTWIIEEDETYPMLFYSTQPFKSTWNTSLNTTGSSNITSVKLPLVSNGEYNFIVEWGDGSNDRITSWNQAETTHNYASEGVYDISIYGQIEGWLFAGSGDRNKILDISQWGILKLKQYSGGSYFRGCENLDITATDALDLTGIVTMSSMFASCHNLDTDNLNLWDVSNVIYMDGLFYENYIFNGSLSSWNTSSVTDMNNMFIFTNLFNQDISGWDVSNVYNMNGMFRNALSFNYDISIWNTSGVTRMGYMFDDAIVFNQDISSWDTSSVTDMRHMFHGANTFNQNISLWDTSNVKYMEYMFQDASNFNQDVGNWNVSSSNYMMYMFYNATSFNQDISQWDILNVEDMSNMLNDSALSTENYNKILESWSQQSVQNNVQFDAGNIKYSSPEAEQGISTLEGTYSWDINNGGTAPYIFDSVIINNQNGEDLLGYCNGTKLSMEDISFYYRWYKDGVLNNSGHTGTYSSPAYANIDNITASETQIGEEWVLSCLASEGSDNSSWLNSSEVTILNTEPVVTEANITNTDLRSNNTPLEGFCNATDYDSDTLTYEYDWYVNNIIVPDEVYTCYQESANITNQTGIDDSCSLNYNGSYDLSTANFLATYKKPIGALTSSKWKVKQRNDDSATTVEYDIPESCFYSNELQFKIYSQAGYSGPYDFKGFCYNGSSWLVVWENRDPSGSTAGTSGYSEHLIDGDWNTYAFWVWGEDWGIGNDLSNIYEEAMVWDINKSILDDSNYEKDDDIIFSCRATDGTDYSEWMNSSAVTILNTEPVTQEVNITTTDLRSNNTLEGYCNVTDYDEDYLFYDYEWYVNNTKIDIFEYNNWESNSSIYSGITSVGSRNSMTTFSDSGVLKAIIGSENGNFYGFYLNNSIWIADSGIVNGLIDVGTYSFPTVFYDDNKFKLITGSYSSNFYGYYWNGTEWISDSNIVNGLSSSAATKPTVYRNNGNLYLVTGIDNSFQLRSHIWNGSSWNFGGSSLPWTGTYQTAAAIFNDGGTIRAIVGGNLDRNYNGYYLDGGWVSDSNIVSGLPNSQLGGSHVFEDAGVFKFIRGTPYGLDGFILNETGLNSDYYDKDNNISLSCRATDGTNYSEWLNSSAVTILNTEPVTNEVNITTTDLRSNTSQLEGFCNVTDYDLDSLTYEYDWYKNGVLIEPYCYQETANVSTACGGLDTGVYDSSGSTWSYVEYIYDENWNLGGYTGLANQHLYINYTIPDNVLSTSLWQIRGGDGITINKSIPSSCWNISNNLVFRLTGGLGLTTDWYCYNTTDWVSVHSTVGTSRTFFEESMYWRLDSKAFENLTNEKYDKDDNITFSCRATDGTNYSEWLNSSEVTILNTEPVITEATITTTDLRSNNTLEGFCNATDFDSDVLTYEYDWYKNDVSLSIDNINLSNDNYTHFDDIIFSCRATDGTDYSEWMNSSEVTILNTEPVAHNIILDALYPEEDATAYCNITDYDNDVLTYNYTWYVNELEVYNESILLDESILDNSYFDIGDIVSVSCDGTDGINITDILNTALLGECYQESFNETNQTGIDGNCGLNYGGVSTITNDYPGIPVQNISYLNDGDWNTKTEDLGNEVYYFTYKKPSYDYDSVQIKIKTGDNNTQFIDIPMVCDNISEDNISFYVSFNLCGGMCAKTYLGCYNGTSYEWDTGYTNILEDITGTAFYESAMIWGSDDIIINHGIESYNDFETNQNTSFPEIGDTITFNGTVNLYDDIDTCLIEVKPVGAASVTDTINTTETGTTTGFFNSSLVLSTTYNSDNDNVSWRTWCNDTSGNYNYSDYEYFTVKDVSQPTIPTNFTGILVNGTVVDNIFNSEVHVNVTFEDDNLFQASVNVTCEESGEIYYWEKLDINDSTYVFDTNGNYNVSLDYNISTLNMTDGCDGEISFAPDATYDLTVCAENQDTGLVSESCKTYTSGEYTVGDVISTESANMKPGNYRLKITWERIKDPDGRYDHGGSYTSSVNNVCGAQETSSSYSYASYLSTPSTCSDIGTDLFLAEYFNSLSGCGAVPGCTMHVDYLYETYSYPASGPNISVTTAKNYNTYNPSKESCRVDESFVSGAETSITSSSCYDYDGIGNPCPCSWSNDYIFITQCTDGNAIGCPADICTYAGTNTEYTEYFAVGNTGNTVSTEFTEDKINSTGEIIYTSEPVDDVEKIYITDNAPQRCNITFMSSDAHTAQEIPEYDYSITDNSITYNTENGATIIITSADDIKNIDTNKLIDRYNFEFEYDDSKLIRKYIVDSDKKLFSRENSGYPGHFVVWNEENHKGNWIDFNLPNSNDYTYIINKLTDYKYEIILVHKVLSMPENKDMFEKNNDGSIFDSLFSFFTPTKPIENPNMKEEVKQLETKTELSSQEIKNIAGIKDISQTELSQLENDYGIKDAEFNSIGGTNIAEVKTYFYIGGVFNVTSYNLYNGSGFTNYTMTYTSPLLSNITVGDNVTSYITDVPAGEYDIEITHDEYITQSYEEEMTTIYDECEQELANVSTVCGGLATGTYNIPVTTGLSNTENMFDSNESTYMDVTAFGYTYIYANYSVPTNITFSGWDITAFGDSESVEIPLDTDGKTTLELRIGVKQGDGNTNIIFEEYNGTAWENLVYSTAYLYQSKVYEEKMIWYNQTENMINIDYNTSQALITFEYYNVKSEELLDDYNITVYNMNTTQQDNYTVTDGSSGITLPLNAIDYYNITIVKTGYENTSGIYTYDYKDVETETIYVSYYATFNILDEDTLEQFDFGNPAASELKIFCADSTTVTHDITNTTNTSIDILIDCEYEKFKFVITYADGISYYRKILVPFEESFNQTIYLIDLTTTPFVYTAFIIDDLLGDYENPSIWVKKNMADDIEVIQSDYVDIEEKLGTYLIENDEYIIEVHSDNNPIQVIGFYGADEGEDKILNMYDVSLETEQDGFYQNARYTIAMLNESNISSVFFSYSDPENLTTSVQYKVYTERLNGTLVYQSAVYTDVESLGAVTFPITHTAYENSTLVGQMIINHQVAGEQVVSKLLNKEWGIPLGIEDHVSQEFLNWFFVILLSVLAITASYKTNMMGLVISGLGLIFALFGWFNIGIGVLGLAIVVSLLSLLKGK